MNNLSTRDQLEKENFDLRNLLAISKSLNSTLDYTVLNDSILYTCLGALTVIKAAFFSKKSIDSSGFSLHRSYLGFELDHSIDYLIPEKGPLVDYLKQNFRCHTLPDLVKALPDCKEMEDLSTIQPALIVPLKAKGDINGLLMIGEKIDNEDFSERDKMYLMDIGSFAAIAIHNAFLFEMTTTDMMTKLKMKHFFMNTLRDRIQASGGSGSDLSLIMVDIDHFKILNDTYGHLTGDEVLKKVAKTIQDNVRQVDVAARYGGEEFIVMLPDADLALARIVAERIRKAIEISETQFKDTALKVTVSLGITQFDFEKDHHERDFIERADKALYQSKEHGRNLTTAG